MTDLETMIRQAVAELQAGNVEAWERLNALAWGETPDAEQYTEADFATFRRVMEALGVPESQWLEWHNALIDIEAAELAEFVASERALARKLASQDKGLNDGLTARASKK